MSETMGFEAVTTYEEVVQAYELDSFGMEIARDNKKAIVEQWGDELLALVATNANRIVRCSWMGNAEVTVETAMNAYSYPPNLTAEDEPFLISVVYELLANEVTEIEQPEEESEPEAESEPKEVQVVKTEDTDQKSDTKIKTQKDSTDTNMVNATRPAEIKNGGPKNPEQTSGKPKKPTRYESSIPERNTNLLQTESKDYAQGVAEDKVTDSASNDSANTVRVKTSDAVETLAVTLSVTSGLAPEYAPTQDGQEFIAPKLQLKDQASETKLSSTSKIEIDQRIPNYGTPAGQIAASPIIEEQPAAGRPELAEDQTAQPFTPQEAIGVTVGSDITETLILNASIRDILSDTAELTDETIEVEAAQPPLDYLMDVDGLVDWVEGEVLLDQFEDAPILQAGNEFNLSEQTGVNGPEHHFQINSTVEEIEGFILQLVEHIEAREPEIKEIIDESLDKIIEVSAKLEVLTDISTTPGAEALEDIFTKLFDKLGIDYTPELTESLTYLILRVHLAGGIGNLMNEEVDETPHDYGTHEIIKKLLVSAGTTGKARSNAEAIGKSALSLIVLTSQFRTKCIESKKPVLVYA